MRNTLLAIVFFFFSSSHLARAVVSSDFDYNATCINAYTCIMTMRFDQAQALIQQEQASHPRNKIPLMLQNYIDVLSILIYDDQDDYDKRIERLDEVIDIFEKSDTKSPYHLFAMAETRALKAIARFKFDEYFSAALELYRAKSLLDENISKFPAFELNKKWLGVIQCLSGTIPDNYRWLGQVLGYKGSIEQGTNNLLNLLKTSGDSVIAAQRNEIQMLLSIVYLNLTSDRSKQVYWLTTIQHECEGKPLLTYCAVLLAIKTFNNDLAIKLLTPLVANPAHDMFYFASYQMGIASLNKLDAKAFYCFEKFLAHYKGRSYVKAAYQKLAWCMLVNGYTKNYQSSMAKVVTRGMDLIDEDKLALKEATSGVVPNVMLLKARLLFDGGYFNNALTILSNPHTMLSLITSKDKIEHTYRMARVYHEMNNVSDAIAFYKRTIDSCKDQEYYFGPNSALMLGMIYEKAGNLDDAVKYYEMVPKLHTDEYRNSLNIKAKAYLNHLTAR
jgi:tetratricopeptide (TPR) repeat protein